MTDDEISAALFVLSDPERVRFRVRRLQRTRRLIFGSLGLVVTAFVCRVLFVVFLTTLYIQPMLVGLVVALALGLCLALVSVHSELRMLAYVEALRQLGELPAETDPRPVRNIP